MAAMVQAFLDNAPARPVLITPVPVVEAIANEHPGFAAMRMTWRKADIEACAEIVRELASEHDLTHVDLVDVFGVTPDPAMYLDDGLHPNAAGHAVLVAAVLRTLARE